MRTKPFDIKPAQPKWRDHTPESTEYGDIYFSTDNGLAETRYVFLEHNQLEQRWKNLDPHTNGCFVIAETGFGTGLNFLACCELWEKTAPPNWQLHFISVEKHPLYACDLQQALQAWPELKPYSQQLITLYPHLMPGHHLLNFNNNIQLQLIFDDVINGFKSCLLSNNPLGKTLGYKIDAWILDGFSPSTNPDMWQNELFSIMAMLSDKNTSFATFTAAAIVKNGLKDNGFDWYKAKGFGRKRDMIYGSFSGHNTEKLLTERGKNNEAKAAWQVNQVKKPKTAIVIGGGLAGSSTAYALARKGIKVKLLEKHHELAGEASGNPSGMLYLKPSPHGGLLNRFNIQCYLFAVRFYKQLQEQSKTNFFNACGLVQLATDQKDLSLFKELAETFAEQSWIKVLDKTQSAEHTGLKTQQDSFFLPESGYLHPKALCQFYTQHANITVLNQQNVNQLNYDKEEWQVITETDTFIADAVVIANSHDAVKFEYRHQLPLKTIRGQISIANQSLIRNTPKSVVCHEGYITPPNQQTFSFGASFDLNSSDKSVTEQDHQYNLDTLHKHLDNFFIDIKDEQLISQLTGRANLRCSTTDYLPICGPVVNHEIFSQHFYKLSKNANTLINPNINSYHPNLYIHTALGAKGLTLSPLCAEVLAGQITQTPIPLARELVEAIHPARFLLKKIYKNQ